LAKRIKIRAERRAGELLIEMKADGKLAKPGANQRKKQTSRAVTSATLADLGVSPNQSSQWQRIAEVPEAKFEKIVESDSPSDSPSRATVLDKPFTS
jgi:hypothetical protein